MFIAVKIKEQRTPSRLRLITRIHGEDEANVFINEILLISLESLDGCSKLD